MASPGENRVYATLLLSDNYLPGALVLAHSLRDAGTRYKLAVLVTLDSVSAEAIAQLRTVYDYIFPVPRIRNGSPGNLSLMDRPDLHSAFTKINLWKLTEFSKIVYIDADVVAYQAPDELFNIPHPFAAAADIGWPDLFNTGVMVLKPDMNEYYAMMAMAERGVSFDGADQGLINMHFGDRYHRLSFTYNVTPSAHYQYVPAYRHFQSSINMVHFIGSKKPWFTGRDAPHGSGPFDEMVGRWWAVYDRHYRVKETVPKKGPRSSEYVQYFTKGEFHPRPAYEPGTGEHQNLGQHDPALAESFHPTPPSHDQPGYHHHESIHERHEHHEYDEPRREEHHEHNEHHEPHYESHDEQRHEQHQVPRHEQHHEQHHEPRYESHHEQHHEQHHERHEHEEPRYESHHEQYHEQHHERHEHDEHHEPHFEQHHGGEETKDGTSGPVPAPPASHVVSHSESVSFAQGTQAEARPDPQVYSHYDGGAPRAEHRPEPAPIPMHNWDAQRQPPPTDSKPEAINFPSTHYEMSQDTAPFIPPQRYPSPPRNMWYEVPKEPPAPASQPPPKIFPWEQHQPAPTRSFVEVQSEPSAPEPASGPEWSEPMGELSTLGSVTTENQSNSSTPTTPTAIKVAPVDPWSSFPRINAWDEVPEIERYVEGLQGHRRNKSKGSPVRLGVSGTGERGGLRLRGLKLTDFPSEADRPSLPVTPAPIRRPSFWSGDPGADEGEEPRQLPEAEGVPTQSDWDPMERLQQLAKQQSEALLHKLGSNEAPEGEPGVSREIPSRPLPFGSEPDLKSRTYVTQSVPGGVLSPQPVKGEATTSILRNISGDNFEPDSVPKISIPEPSYSGPGAAWEKGEMVPERETPLLPTDEGRDVLDT
ncbi:family 8 glycosyl transferase [Thelonectria olida]|uniref:glycogenin glucosyltransferase n=1 Tax=Thelonectria olida TaxID=1576542 RepID=A0A9P8W570_9HYPO|nr:family 8 glycosyl transferase [Thelonectria olida]